MDNSQNQSLITDTPQGNYPLFTRKENIFKQFIKFYSMPDPEKCEMFNVPYNEKKGKYDYVPNQTHFAKKFGVAQLTLSRWKKMPNFYNEVQRHQDEWGLERTPNVMAALYRRCLRFGISSDIELYLAYYQKWDRKHIIKLQGEKYDLDDIRALVGALPEARQKQFYELITTIIGETETSIKHSEVSKYGTAESEANTIDVRGEADPTPALIGAGDKVS